MFLESAWNHLIQDFDASKNNFGIVQNHPELIDINFSENINAPDWMHTNSIDYNSELDQIILSSRDLNEVFIIDHSTTTAEAAAHSGGNSGKGGDILYRWGNPQNYDRGTEADQKLFGQHDAQWIEAGLEDEGKLMVFNNGLDRPEGNYSTIDIWEAPMDAEGNYIINDEAFGPTDLYWTYSETPTDLLYSSNTSGVQRLPNGNTLICQGKTGHLTEVTSEGQKVWDYVSPVVSQGFITQGNTVNNNNLFTAKRYSPDYQAFDNVELIAGNPLELNPTNQDCPIYDEMVLVRENSLLLENIRVLNTLIGAEIFIENNTKELVHFEILDLTGRIVLKDNSAEQFFTVNAESLNAGIYLIRFFNVGKNRFYSVKVVKV